MKLIKKTAIIVLVVITLGTTLGGVLLFTKRATIINLLAKKINQHITTKMEVKSIDLKLVKSFPNISVQFTDVKFHSTFDKELLLESEYIYFVLNIVDIFYKKITVERLEIENAKFHFHTNKNGDNNFDVFKIAENQTPKNKLNIKSTKLLNVKLETINDRRNIKDVYLIHSLEGSAQRIDSIYQFNIVLNGEINKTNQKYLKWMTHKKIHLKTESSYNAKLLHITMCELEIDGSLFNLNGLIGFNAEKKIKIDVAGSDLKLSNLTALLGKQDMDLLNGKGMLKFNALLEGNYISGNFPRFYASFKLNDFEVSYPNYIYPIKKITLEGNIHLNSINNLANGKVILKKFSGYINKKKLEGSATITNFNNAQVVGTIKGKIDLDWVLTLADKKNIQPPFNGVLTLDLATSFKINSSKENEFTATGEVAFSNTNIATLYTLPLKSANGKVIFIKDKVELINWHGIYGKNNFNIDGDFSKKYSLKAKKAKYESTIKFTSSHINLNEIIDTYTRLTKNSTTTNKATPQLANFTVDLSLNVDQLKFNKFHGTDLKTELSINQHGIKIKKISAQGLGGSLAIKGNITKQFTSDYHIEANVKTQSINLDSLFYVLNNFNQNFITSSFIKGKIDSDIYLYLYFDKKWNFKRNLFYSKGLFKIKKGELNNFAPIMSLSSYLKNEDENLSKLRFSDLETKIIIKNDTVFIPDMHIGTNVRNIKIGGYHTLNQELEYRLLVPLINNIKDKDELFGYVKKDKSGMLHLPFKIKGTTSNYKISYDLKKVRSTFAKGIKEELLEIENLLLRKKVIKDKDTLLLDDDFFDWDDN